MPGKLRATDLGASSALLIGKNGSGKTTVGLALRILQKIARGTNRVSDLVKPKDFARGRTDVPMRFEIEIELEAKTYAYSIALDLPKGAAKELRVQDVTVRVGGEPVYTPEVDERIVKSTSISWLCQLSSKSPPTILYSC